MPRLGITQAEILSGWKEIANYLGKGVRTVQRYERELGLPVRRPAGKLSGSVIATKAEMDAWISARPLRKAFSLHLRAVDTMATIKGLKQQLAELHQLREESARLRHEMNTSRQRLDAALHLLRESLTIEAGESRLRDVLTFDSERKAN